MGDQIAVLTFVQGKDEPFYLAWERYKELLRYFPNHGFTREEQILNFLDGLPTATRIWVEGGNGTASFYDQSADDAFWLLEHLAGYDYECWNVPMDYHGSEDIFYSPAQLQDLSPQLECFSELYMEAIQCSKATRHEGDPRKARLELLQALLDYFQSILSRIVVPQGNSVAAMSKRDEIQRAQLQVDDIQNELRRLNAPPNSSNEIVLREVECKSFQEPSTKCGFNKIFYDDDESSDEETQVWVGEEEPQDDVSPLEIHIVMPPLFVKESIFEYPKWSAPPPPSFEKYFESSQAHFSKRSFLARTFFVKANLAKLEGFDNRDPWDVSYDIYHGRRPLFDEPSRVAMSSYRR